MQLFKRRSRMGNDDILISCLAYGLSFLIILSVIYPLVYVISASISDPMRVENGDLILWPVGFTLEGYQEILRYEQIWVGYRNTILYTVCGTSLNLLVTLPCAYALSRKELFGRYYDAIHFYHVFFGWYDSYLPGNEELSYAKYSFGDTFSGNVVSIQHDYCPHLLFHRHPSGNSGSSHD